MNLKKMVVAVASAAMFLLMVSSVLSQAVHRSGMPKCDEIWYKAYVGAEPDVVVDEFLAGVTEWIGGPSRSDLYAKVVDAGHKVSPMDPMAEFTFFPINCRDFKETSGEMNRPLNDTAFRMALSYIYGMDDKQADIYGYYQVPWHYALGNPCPDAQTPYYDETVQMPNTDYVTAWSILQGAGYAVDADGWLAKDGVKVRPDGKITCLYSTGSLFYPEGPLGGFARNFNAFLTYIGATGPTMEVLPTEFSTLVGELMVQHDYDVIGIGLTNLGRYVDWIYDLSHSSLTGTWGWNFAGIVDAEFDEWGVTILTSMDEDEVIAAAQAWQAKFVYELMPWFPVRAGLEFCTTWRSEDRELVNLVSMRNYGPMNTLSWATVHWKGEPGVAWPGGLYKVGLGDEPDTLNPYTDNTLYGWQLMNRAVEDLYLVHPVTLKNKPFVATEWITESWVSIPEIGIEEGSKTTYYLRQDVTWHDGYPVTAYDCVENMRVMREYKPGRYSSCWANLVYAEADGPYKFTAYFYTTSLYYADYVAGAALLAPKHIIELVEKQVEDGVLEYFEDWTPCDLPYKDLTGVDPPAKYPFMKQLVGCSGGVFDYYDRSLATGHVVRYEEFAVNAPVVGAVVGEWRIDPDTAYTYKVLACNAGACEDSEMGELVPVTFDVKVYVDDVLAREETGITLEPWDWIYLGPYTTAALAAGEHTIRVEIYEGATLMHTYTHTFVVTIREDINTYTGTKLDFKVNILDISRAAAAFGSSAEAAAAGTPAGLRWDPPTDVDDNFKVNIIDIAKIAAEFGWEA